MLSSYAFTCHVGDSARRYLKTASSRRWAYVTNSFLPQHRFKFCTQPGHECPLYSNRYILSIVEHCHEVMLANGVIGTRRSALKDAQWRVEKGSSFTSDHSSMECTKIRHYGRIAVPCFNLINNSTSPITFYRKSEPYSSSFYRVPAREYSTKLTGSDHDNKEKQVTTPGAFEGSGFSSIARSASSVKSESSTKTHVEGAGSFSFSYFLSKAFEVSSWVIRNTFHFLIKSPGVLLYYVTHPKELSAKMSEFKEHAKKEANHYWMGMKVIYFVLDAVLFHFSSSFIAIS